ncbi:SIR2 family protein [Vibrio vulnificus]|uniref:SIR2 family protein n=1 Tax=Vibrio vulnificus TaxID=672 RepID=UPI001EEB17BE|nr:SIR2 family protein [Vibrio vulnificus]
MTNMNSDQSIIALIKRYPVAITHLRQVSSDRKLGVVLGAGLSLSAGFPSWPTLLGSISSEMHELGINGENRNNNAEPMQAQYLFSRFKNHYEQSAEFSNLDRMLHEPEIATKWRDLIRKSLYKNVGCLDDKIGEHPYLKDLAQLCHKVPLVVSYNFDELLEKALHQTKNNSDTIGYYTAWGPNFVIQNNRPVVYHPNGFIPEKAEDRYSETVVLTEESISDQIIESATGKYRLLFDYFSKSPCLFLGFSLNDPGMRSILRQTERASPGTIHYYVHYCANGKPSEEEIAEISRVNFELYNFVTLFLNDDEISTLIKTISLLGDDKFSDLYYEAGVDDTYLYHLAGPVSVGKTSCISRLQGMSIVDEWLEQRNNLIAKPSNELNSNEVSQVDEWILGQVRQKNRRFKTAKPGIHVMDRAPVDAFAFVEEDKWPNKANQMIDVICRNNLSDNGISKASVIFLSGNAKELEYRQKYRGRKGDSDYLSEQQELLRKVYTDPILDGAVKFIDTRNKSIEAVTKDIVRNIFLSDYKACDFNALLSKYSGNKS